MVDEDLADELGAFGHRFDLSEYERQAYLAVLEHGKLSASRLAEETDIPQPRVYNTVRSLAEDGLVEILDTRPMQILAVDPEETFGDVQATLAEVVDALEKRYTAPARDTEAVSLVTARQTILRYLEDVIEAAEYELVLSLTPALLDRFEPELAAHREAGVTIELLLSPRTESPDPDSFDYTRVATVTRARRGRTAPIVAVADGTYSVYTTRTALRTDRDQYGVIFNRSELGFLVSGFLNTVVWPSAERLAESDHDRPFPRRYATVRRCVRDIRDGSEHPATRNAADHDPFYAAVRGREVATGDHCTVTGEITDVTLSTNRETAAITLATDDGQVTVGDQAAAVEDVEATELVVDRAPDPELSTTDS